MSKAKQLVLAIWLAVLLVVAVTTASTIRMSTVSAQTSAPKSQSVGSEPGLATNGGWQNGNAPNSGAGYGPGRMTPAPGGAAVPGEAGHDWLANRGVGGEGFGGGGE